MNKLQIDFFSREFDLKDYNEYYSKTNKILNLDNLCNFFNKPETFFDQGEYKYFLKYIFSLIKEWVDRNEIFSFSYINNLKKIIKIYKLDDVLNNVEKSYINELESIVFNKNRNLKNIVTEFTLYKEKKSLFKKKEDIFYVFEDTDFNIGSLKFKKGTFIISKTSIVFLYQNKYYRIRFDKIDSYKIVLPNIIIFKCYNVEIKIISNEIKSMYVSFERVYYGTKSKR